MSSPLLSTQVHFIQAVPLTQSHLPALWGWVLEPRSTSALLSVSQCLQGHQSACTPNATQVLILLFFWDRCRIWNIKIHIMMSTTCPPLQWPSPLFTTAYGHRLAGAKLPKQPLACFYISWALARGFKNYDGEIHTHVTCSRRLLKILLLLCWLSWIFPLAEKWVIIVEISAEFEPETLMLM